MVVGLGRGRTLVFIHTLCLAALLASQLQGLWPKDTMPVEELRKKYNVQHSMIAQKRRKEAARSSVGTSTGSHAGGHQGAAVRAQGSAAADKPAAGVAAPAHAPPSAHPLVPQPAGGDATSRQLSVLARATAAMVRLLLVVVLLSLAPFMWLLHDRPVVCDRYAAGPSSCRTPRVSLPTPSPSSSPPPPLSYVCDAARVSPSDVQPRPCPCPCTVYWHC